MWKLFINILICIFVTYRFTSLLQFHLHHFIFSQATIDGRGDEIILLRSNGGSPYYQGHLMGLYQEMETTVNNVTAYEQIHSIPATNGNYIYYLPQFGSWVAGRELGGANVNLLNANNNTKLLPRRGWQYVYKGGKWTPDPKLRIIKVNDTGDYICSKVTVTASGEALKIHQDIMGEFRPTDLFSAGRPVYINHKNYYLLVHPLIGWAVSSSPASKLVYIQGGTAPDMNPESSKTSVHYNINTLRYPGIQYPGSKFIYTQEGSSPDMSPVTSKARYDNFIKKVRMLVQTSGQWEYAGYDGNWHQGGLRVTCKSVSMFSKRTSIILVIILITMLLGENM